MNLFDKAAVFGDIHFGKKSDSEQHNKDCLEFIKWFSKKTAEHQCDTVIFMGDWYDNRSRLRVDTLNYSWQAINNLISTGLPIYWLIGNHDLFFQTHRGVHSLPYLNEEKIAVINEPTEINDVLFCPWLVGNEFSEVPAYETKYVFGHFELPLFLLNEMIEMPDRGGLHMDHFHENEAIFSGHYHKRQLKVNQHGIPVWYIGNCFPHDFNDVNDVERGCMILEWNHEPVFENWTEGPNYHRVSLSKLLNLIEKSKLNESFNHNSVVECRDDIGIDIEQAVELNEIMSENIRELRLRPATMGLSVSEESDIPEDEQSVDSLIVEHLRKLDTKGSSYDSELLVELYQSVDTS